MMALQLGIKRLFLKALAVIDFRVLYSCHKVEPTVTGLQYHPAFSLSACRAFGAFNTLHRLPSPQKAPNAKPQRS